MIRRAPDVDGKQRQGGRGEVVVQKCRQHPDKTATSPQWHLLADGPDGPPEPVQPTDRHRGNAEREIDVTVQLGLRSYAGSPEGADRDGRGEQKTHNS